MAKKKIIDAKQDKKGNIISVKFSGNKTYTDIKTAKNLTKRGQVKNAHVVQTKKGSYLRTNPDKQKKNNLDDMAGK